MHRIVKYLQELEDRQKVIFAIVVSVVIALFVAGLLTYMNTLIQNSQLS